MIRIVEQTKSGRHRVLSALVGLYSTIEPSGSDPIHASPEALSNTTVTYSLFDKFGEEQLKPTENTMYVLMITAGRIIPVYVEGFDPKTDKLTFCSARVKHDHGEKVQVEISRLMEHLKVDKENKSLTIRLDSSEREENSNPRLLDVYNRTSSETAAVYN